MSTNTDTIIKKKVDYDDINKDFKKWNVIFYNDDHTTVDFVIFVLQEIFNHNEQTANELTMKIHNNGKETVGTYILEIAEQKANDTLYLAYQYGFPLKVKVVKEE